MTTLDDLIHSLTVAPRRSVPPPNEYEPWAEILARYADGYWHLIKEYKSGGSARTVASRERARVEGNWEFRSGRTERGYAVWARNLDGPMMGEDEE